MPLPLNITPRGLLGLLDAKTAGQAPRELNQVIQPVLDIFPHYVAQKAEWMQISSGVIASTGSFAPTATIGLNTVPSDEIWFVLRGACRGDFIANAGEFYGVSAFWSEPVNGLGAMLGNPSYRFTTGGFPYVSWDTPFVGLPAERMRFWCYDFVSGAGRAAIAQYQVVRCQI